MLNEKVEGEDRTLENTKVIGMSRGIKSTGDCRTIKWIAYFTKWGRERVSRKML